MVCCMSILLPVKSNKIYLVSNKVPSSKLRLVHKHAPELPLSSRRLLVVLIFGLLFLPFIKNKLVI